MLLRACIALAMVAAVVPARQVHGQACGYEIETVVYGPGCGSILPPATMQPQHLRAGVAVGWFTVCTVEPDEAFVWSPAGGLDALPRPAGSQDAGASASEGDTVVGWFRQGNLEHALLWDGGAVLELGTGPGGNWSEASAISNGVVVGTWGNSVTGPIRACRWRENVFEDLAPLIGGYISFALDVNAAGSIVGRRYPALGEDPIAFLLEGEELTLLGPLPGGFESQARAMSDAGDIVGSGQRIDDATGELTVRAFLWRSGVMTELESVPGFRYCAALDINQDGSIVGEVWGPGNVAVIWINGEIWSLQDLVADPQDLSFSSAVSIDDDGRILVSANVSSPIGDRVAAILVPVETLPADLDCDGQVGLDDFEALLDAWGPCPATGPCSGDIDGNGAVGIIDFLALLAGWT